MARHIKLRLSTCPGFDKTLRENKYARDYYNNKGKTTKGKTEQKAYENSRDHFSDSTKRARDNTHGNPTTNYDNDEMTGKTKQENGQKIKTILKTKKQTKAKIL